MASLGLNGLTYLPLHKMAAISRRHFQMHFHEWKVLYSDSKFIEVCSYGSKWQEVSVGSGNGLAPNRRQAIIWTNAPSSLTHICGIRARWVNLSLTESKWQWKFEWIPIKYYPKGLTDDNSDNNFNHDSSLKGWQTIIQTNKPHINGLMQDYGNFIAKWTEVIRALH